MRRMVKRKTPTSSAGRPGDADGFTLLELLVVLAVVALVAALAVPSFRTGSDGRVRLEAHDVAAALRLARNRALVENQPVRFSLDTRDRAYTVDGARQGVLAEGIDIRMVAAETERGSPSMAAIRFFPDGSATGGSITLANGRVRHKITVDWLTGRVLLAN